MNGPNPSLNTGDSEEVIIKKIQGGDRQMWEEVVKHYYPALLNFIVAMVKDRETAEELVQDIFVNFWVKREKINITTSLKAYLYRASRNHTLNYIKRRNFEQDYQRSLLYTQKWHHNETEDQFHFNELEKKLNQAIDTLPEKSKEIFLLSRFEGLTYKEIAETLDIPVRTVHYQIGNALKHIRSELKGIANPNLMTFIPWLLLGFYFLKPF
ncbi:RNA polymerase sigma-70 factor [Sediminitomix flava]|uniref:RNA polymerase sigma-70 factor (ECF subfamily) n=1 Tax=Sediminitomix flava TaxID=379075 RepID=A0A315ZAW7_SEDFL|nr:RNA polymerase sigma-70 factor [Sediminitomix flava]PWJ42736.1 RNA polymerase sigma-70 factor (ECF subfamily) [Sediminitomix flava]